MTARIAILAALGACASESPSRGTPPTVEVVAPNQAGTLVGTIDIAWSATDSDVDPITEAPDELAIDLALVRFATHGTEIATETIARAHSNTGTFSWPLPSTLAPRDSAGTAIPYRVRVTATDMLGMPRNVRSDDSDAAFFVEHVTTTEYTWADVQPILAQYCGGCHGDPAQSASADYFCLLQYKRGEATPPCSATDTGAFEMRGAIYGRLVTLQNMPPLGEAEPSPAQRELVGNWIRGGAPYGM